MPELPEVEVTAQALRPALVGGAGGGMDMFWKTSAPSSAPSGTRGSGGPASRGRGPAGEVRALRVSEGVVGGASGHVGILAVRAMRATAADA